MFRSTMMAVVATAVPVSAAGVAVPVVRDGKAQAVVVIPEKPSPVVEYAAQEWVYHVQKATGVTLSIQKEGNAVKTDAPRLYLGPTAAATAAGIRVSALPPDGFLIRTLGKCVFVVGRDSDGDPLSPDTWAGTLFGVYELLEQALGVRWLWPGELGEHVPRTATITIPEMDRKVSPRLVIRRLRSTIRRWPGAPISDLAHSPEAFRQAQQDEAKWLRRHRMGHSRKVRWGHAFTDWWDRYGKEHPDWFNLLEDGQRRPQSGSGASASMCVSNPGFHQQVIENWLKEWRAAPADNKPNINACENDVFGRCTCPACKAWDVPRPDAATYPDRFSRYGIVSDRYARFWRTLQEMAAQYDPNAIVTGYAYVNYAPPPVREKLNDHVWIGLVPDSFFPRTPEEHRQCREMWAGWAKTGCRLFLRPNYTLDGYGMPYLYTHQFADEFAYCARHGMIATDFDSLTGMWAAQGPQQYLFARWQTCLEKPVDAVLAEYYSGFGPAARAVKAYFDYWEDYLTQNRDRLREIAQRTSAGWNRFARKAHECFPPEAFAKGWRLLDEAASAAKNDPTAAARVEFLRKGLTHAEKCAALSRAHAQGDPAAVEAATADLRRYRRQIERDNVANLTYCAWIEWRSFGGRR